VSTDNPETAASVTIGALGYRARCTEAGCGNLARLGLRYADAGGRPMTNLVFCHRHGRLRVERDGAAGLRFTTIARRRDPSLRTVNRYLDLGKKNIQVILAIIVLIVVAAFFSSNLGEAG